MAANPTGAFRQINPFIELKEVREIWKFLSSASNHSFFISWGWIEAWITTLPREVNINFIVRMHDNRPVFAFFYGKKTSVRHFFVVSRGIFLNSTGDSYYDSIFIEHNSMIVDPSYNISAGDLQNIPLPTWDEFILPGFVLEQYSTENHIFDELKRDKNTVVYINEKAYFIDLDEIRKANHDYLSLLSSNRRQQIKRSIREYEKEGEIKIEMADSLAKAQLFFGKMVELHQAEWKKRGKPGAFANAYLCLFHTTLIKNRFEHDEIQLLHIYTNQGTVGYLYNFVYNRRVSFYQGGFNYRAGNNYRPGMVSHYYAILFNIKENNLIYDFLAGDSPYKESLSTGFKVMKWVRIQKYRPQFLIENFLKTCKATLLNIRDRRDADDSLARKRKN